MGKKNLTKSCKRKCNNKKISKKCKHICNKINKNQQKKEQLRQKTFKKLKCSPLQNKRVTPRLKGLTCYDNDKLFRIKKKWNSKYPNKLIHVNDPVKIWHSIKHHMKHMCKNELCWVKKLFKDHELKDNKFKQHFRPVSPRSWSTKPNEWLSSVDILKVIRQYEKSNPNFKFLGPSPIDFDTKQTFGSCVWENLCKFDLSKFIKKNITKIGIIFNLDTHDQPGSHWTALFVDVDKKFIFYFDSNGDKYPKEVDELVKRIKQQGSNLNIKFKFDSNKDIEHQQKDGQCGMYTLYFIIELLKGEKTPRFFKKTKISDDLMKTHRTIYYNDIQE